MRNSVLFLAFFFYTMPAFAQKSSATLDRYQINRAKDFVNKLPRFSPLQDNDQVLRALVDHRELNLAFEVEEADEQADNVPHFRDLFYICTGLKQLTFLKKLSLTGMGLTEIPEAVFAFPNLVKLDLSDNALQEVDQRIRIFTNLEELDLSGNFIASLPDQIGDLGKLKRVRLARNALQNLPDHFGELKQMRRLDLSDNAFRYVPMTILNFEKMTRLDMSDNLIQWVPCSFKDLDKLKKFNLRDNPLVGVGWAYKLGARELRALFEKRVWISEERFEGVATFQPKSRRSVVEESLWHVEKLAEARLFEAEENHLSGGEVLDKITALWDGLVFDDARKDNYLDHTLLYEPSELESFITVEYGEGDEAIRIERFVPREMTNAEMMRHCVLPKIKGFVGQLFETGEKTYRNKGWQPKTKDLPAFRAAFAQALLLIEGLEDVSARLNALGMLLKGILHCPTAQKSAYDTLIGQLTAGTETQADTLPDLIKKGLARLKERKFVEAMIQDGNAQNSHLLQYYKEKLGDILGLSNATVGFVDENGRMGFDCFFGRPGNALAYFFTQFQPAWAAGELCDKSYKLTPREVGAYLIENRLVDYEGDENWWKAYFTADPTASHEAKVKSEAVSLALKHLGYVKG